MMIEPADAKFKLSGRPSAVGIEICACGRHTNDGGNPASSLPSTYNASFGWSNVRISSPPYSTATTFVSTGMDPMNELTSL